MLSTTDVDLTGGVERVVVECANRLSETGHDVAVIAARVDRSVLAPGVDVRTIGVPAKLDARTGLGFRRRATRLLEKLRPDAHGNFSALSPLGGVFWIPSVHRVGYDLLLSRRNLSGRLALRAHPYHAVRLWMERTMMAPGGHARLIAQSEELKADVIRAYGVPPENIEVLPYAYDDGKFNAGTRALHRAETRARLGYGDDDKVILFVANELERKGWDTLSSAVERLGDPCLRVLGAGRVAPESTPSWVNWIGPSRDVAPLYAAADAFVLPTRYEPWGLVIVEALGSGLPTVTTRLAGAAEAVRDGETGLLLENPESATELASAIEWAVSGAAADLETTASSVGRYAWSSIADRYAAILGEVASATR
ncbi:MAG TPA: glycosyltransferase family 4 protein [Thermoleophilaceae bacterium]